MIELARDSDGPQIVAITAKAGVFTEEEVDTVRELWGDSRQGEESGYVFLVAREGEAVLGYTCFGPRSLTEGTFDLYWLAVDPSAQGRGIARALIERAEQEVRQRGGRLLILETSGTPAYEPARRLYSSCSYRIEAVIRDFYHPGDDLYLYSKHLV